MNISVCRHKKQQQIQFQCDIIYLSLFIYFNHTAKFYIMQISENSQIPNLLFQTVISFIFKKVFSMKLLCCTLSNLELSHFFYLVFSVFPNGWVFIDYKLEGVSKQLNISKLKYIIFSLIHIWKINRLQLSEIIIFWDMSSIYDYIVISSLILISIPQ